MKELEQEIKKCIDKGGDCPEKDICYCIFHNWYCPHQMKDVIQGVSYCLLKIEKPKILCGEENDS
jgi:hypothetical protein